MFLPSAFAVSNPATWTGGDYGTNHNWSNSGNWTPSNPDGAGQTIIHFAGSTGLNPFNDYGAFTQFNQILFDAGASSFTLSGAAVKLTANGGSVAKIENNSANTLQTVSFNSSGNSFGFIGSGELDPTAGDLTISNDIFVDTTNGTISVFGGTAHTLTLNGRLINGSATASLTNQSNNIIVLNAANTYTGDTTINAGKLQFGVNGTSNNSTIRLGPTTGAATAEVDLLSSTGGQTISSIFNPRAGGTGLLTVASQNTSGTNTLSGHFGLDRDLTINQTGGGTLAITQVRAASGDTTTGIDIKNKTLTTTDAGTVRIGGVTPGSTTFGTIYGSGGVIRMSGTGTLFLNDNNNSYTGGTIIDSGTVSVGSMGATGTGAITFNGGTLQITGGTNNSARGFTLNNTGTIDITTGTFTFSGAFGGNSGLTKTGAGIMTLSGASNTYLGTTTIDVGTLRLASGDNRLPTGTNLIVNSGATFDLNALNQTVAQLNDGVSGGGVVANVGGGLATVSTLTVTGTGTFSGSINDGASTRKTALTKSTGGVLTLSGSSNYTGTTTISAGILNIQNNAGLGSTTGGTSVANGATLQLQGNITVGAEALSLNGGAASGQTGALVNVSGTNTYGGAITIAASSSISAASSSVLNLTGGVIKNGTTLTLTGGGTINISGTGISGASANSDLVVDGVTTNLNVANNYNGPTFIRNAGVLNANVTNALPTVNGRTAVTMDDSGTGSSNLTLGASQSAASLTGASTSTIALGSNTLTVGASSGSTTFAGIISGTGGNLIKDGASTQVLSGANTYTGTTTINAGTLEAGAAGALGSTANILVNTGGTLLLSGSGDRVNNSTTTFTLAGGKLDAAGLSETFGALTLTDDSIIDFGGGASTLTFADSTNLWTSGKILSIWNWSGTPVSGGGTDQLRFTGNGLNPTTQLAQIKFYSGPGTGLLTGFFGNDFVGGVGEVVPVPEPSSIAMVMGLLGLIGWRERRKGAISRRGAIA